jgi:hypothetical protein
MRENVRVRLQDVETGRHHTRNRLDYGTGVGRESAVPFQRHSINFEVMSCPLSHNAASGSGAEEIPITPQKIVVTFDRFLRFLLDHSKVFGQSIEKRKISRIKKSERFRQVLLHVFHSSD